MERRIFEEPHGLFRQAFRTFVKREVTPHVEAWEQAHLVDRSVFKKAGASGFLGMAVPEEHGGSGTNDFRYNAIIAEEFAQAGVGSCAGGITLHNDTCLPYFLDGCDEEQRKRWLPGIASGELITAIAMTEPGTGSDLASIRTTAIRRGDHYIVNGAKTFITNGINSDVIVLACKTDPSERHGGISLLVVERATPGFERGRVLRKIGQHSQDTAELIFVDAKVPVANRLGEEGTGFKQLVHHLPQERLSIAVTAVAQAQAAFALTLDYCKSRQAFGQPIGSFQNSRFKLAEMRTEIDLAQVYVDEQVLALNDGRLSAVDAAKAKWWCTEMSWRVLDCCLQLHGGYGYMEEYPIARAWRDGRVPRIYGGTTEIMKEIIGRSFGV
ncbi:MAG TPA: acyl-CoA dehydrogenase family protein [Candidatus Acidoferrum sp.]|nr:acyl-CoA dehydrogenase family protein [Candidatus Acidoferrum sp.]